MCNLLKMTTHSRIDESQLGCTSGYMTGVTFNKKLLHYSGGTAVTKAALSSANYKRSLALARGVHAETFRKHARAQDNLFFCAELKSRFLLMLISVI